MDKKEIAKYIDNTLLKPEATKKEMEAFCRLSKKYGFATVCIPPSYVALAKKILEGSAVKVCTVIGFPLGANLSAVKAFEAKNAIKEGATELDMVINVGALKSGDWKTVENDIREVVQTAKKKKGTIVKVILETCLLTESEIKKACRLAELSGADFVKTSTGMNKRGASLEDIVLMKKSCALKIKAAGGIRDRKTAMEMIEAGAVRIGTSAGAVIVDAE